LSQTIPSIIALAANNFTPLLRTPWAGKMIASSIKRPLLGDNVPERIGESWEFSLDPDFPSLLASGSNKLSDLIAQDSSATLGGSTECNILVKLLNADEPLSVQIHPKDGDPHLKKNECGKPESWLVLDAAPNCGLYLGFARSTSIDELRRAFGQGDAKAHELLNFVPVRAGDYFEIEPGVPHAIGPGVLLLEPQRVVAGLSGKTYRLWDWNRKYDAHGERDDLNGKPRELHLEQGLGLLDVDRQIGDAFVNMLRRRPEVQKLNALASWSRYPSNPYYQLSVFDFGMSGKAVIEQDRSFAIAIALNGSVEVKAADGSKIVFRKGQSGFVTAKSWPLTVTGCSADAKLALLTDAQNLIRARDA
jgi:mannose-6-phosphate isomerase